MTGQDQCREAFEGDWMRRHYPVPMNTRRHDDGRYGDHIIQGQWEAWQAARSAPVTPVELPEPIGVVRVFEPHEGVGKICSEASTDITRLPIGRSLLYTEQQVRELLSEAGTVLPETPESPPKSTETRMDASSDRGGGVLPAGWVAVPVEPTEDMHVAACKVLQRANGLNGTPKRMLDAMLAAAPKLPQGDGWLPIEGAPQYTTILLLGTHGMTAAYMESCGDWKADGVDTTYDMASVVLQIGTLTHWMPLPQPPKEQG